MKTRTIIAALALTLMVGTAAAETTLKVTFLDESRPDIVAQITPESKLNFGGTPYFDFTKCTGAEGRIAIAVVKRITFSGTWMGVEAPKAETAAATLRLRNNPVESVLAVEGFDTSSPAQLSVFSIAGREVIRVRSWRGEDIDVSTLPQGVYILRINQSTLKFVKK